MLKTHPALYEGKTRLKPNKTLDSPYKPIPREVFDGDNPEDDSKARSVLGAMTLATNLLSPPAIATHWESTTTAYSSSPLASYPPGGPQLLRSALSVNPSPTSPSTQTGAATKGFTSLLPITIQNFSWAALS